MQLLLIFAFANLCVTSFRNVPSTARFSRSRLSAHSEYECLSDVRVKCAVSGESLPITELWNPQQQTPVVLAFLTHFADFNAWEYAQKLKHYLSSIDDSNAKLITIGLGTVEAAQMFAELVNFPLRNLYADETGAAYKLLNFSQGFNPPIKVNPYIRLLTMLSGVGSPGTIPAVLKGYTGDKNIDAGWLDSTLQLVDRRKFDSVGKEGARPFEIATVRLQNMIQILKYWNDLSPLNKDLITWQGGTLIFKGKEVIYQYADRGILTYTPIEEVLKVLEIDAQS